MFLNEIEIKDNSRFLTLEDGDTVVRIVSEFVMRTVTFKDGTTATKYSCWVIERKTGKILLASFGAQIMKQLKALASNKDYAFERLPGYDITINRKGTGMSTTYTVTPARKDTPITEQEQSLIMQIGSVQSFIENIEKKDQVNVNEIPF